MNWSPVYVCLLLDQQLKQVEVELNWKAQVWHSQTVCMAYSPKHKK